MAGGLALNQIDFPPSSGDEDVMSRAEVMAASGGQITYGSLMENIKGVWPAPDPTNGPLLADPGIVGTAPSFTGLDYWQWNSGKFNTQSQHWVDQNGTGTPAGRCMNVTTPRGIPSGAPAGTGFPAHLSTSFVANTAKIIIAYYYVSAFTYTDYHECHLWATEANGKLSQIRQTPATWPSGGGSSQMFYRVVTFKEARRRRFKLWLQAGCFFAGIYVDAGARVEKAANRPVLAISDGDSWRDGFGNVFAAFGGNGSVGGVAWPTNCSSLLSNMSLQFELNTDFAVALIAQGGTGFFNAGGPFTDPTLTADGVTPFLSASRVNSLWNFWGAKYPTIWCAGGWNDGGGTSPYLANYRQRVLDAIDRVRAKGAANGQPDVPIIMTGCQPKLLTAGDARDLGNQGQKAACDLRGVPFLDQAFTNWNGQIPDRYIGPDGLHPNVFGAEDQGAYDARQWAPLKLSSGRVLQTLAAP